MKVYTRILAVFIFFQFSSFAQSSSENKINLESNFNLPGYLKLDFGFTLVENKGHSLKSDLFPSRSLDLYYSKPLSNQKVFKESIIKYERIKETEKVCKECLSIPCHANLKNYEVSKIINLLNNFK